MGIWGGRERLEASPQVRCYLYPGISAHCRDLMAKTIYVLNGLNLNLLGTREPETYGHASSPTSRSSARRRRRSWSGGRLPPVQPRGRADRLRARGACQQGGRHCHQRRRLFPHLDCAARRAGGGEIPPSKFTSATFARESFRHHSFTAKAAFATLCGFGIDGYRLAINGLAAKIGAKEIGIKAKA